MIRIVRSIRLGHSSSPQQIQGIQERPASQQESPCPACTLPRMLIGRIKPHIPRAACEGLIPAASKSAWPCSTVIDSRLTKLYRKGQYFL
jgi:hypothetical protein